MKKFTSTLILLLLLAPTSGFAGGAGIGGGDASQIWQIVGDATNGITAGATGVSAVANTAVATLNTIIQPISAAVTAGAVLSEIASGKAFIGGGANGSAPLFVKNTKSYLDSVQNAEYQQAISNLSTASGPYKDSILYSLAMNARQSSASLTPLTQSGMPAIIKKNLCPDAILSARAEADIAAGLGQSGITYQERKKQLYDTFGCGSTTISPQAEKALLAANTQDGSIGGLDALYNLTVNRDNAYARNLAVTTAVAEKAEEAKARALSSANANGGLLPQTTSKKIEKDINGTKLSAGNAPLSPDQDILTPVKSVADTATKAINSGTNLALAGINSANALVGALSAGMSLLDKGLGLFGGSSSGGGSGSGVSANLSAPDTTVVDTTRDMSEEEHTRVTLPIKKQLTKHIDAITVLKSTNPRELTLLMKYKGSLDQLQQCNQRVQAANIPTLASTSTLAGLPDFLSSRYDKINPKIEKINKEAPLIEPALTTMKSTLEKVLSSRNSKEIQRTFELKYQNLVDDGVIPDLVSAATRETEYESVSALVKKDENDEYKKFSEECSRLSDQIAPPAGSTDPVFSTGPAN